jgi:excisionase family DNA binding protein
MPEPLLTPKELANWLRMSMVWVYKQAEKGALPFHRVGDSIRFDPEEIRAYLKDRKDLKRIYPKPRYLKTKRKDAHLVTQQEATKTG